MSPIPRSIPCPQNNQKDMEVSSAPITKNVQTVSNGDNDIVSCEKGERNNLSGITCPITPERKKKETEKKDGPSFLTPPRSSSISRISENDAVIAAQNKDQLSSPPTKEKHENDPYCTNANNQQERFRALLQKEANYTIPAISNKRQNYLSWEDYFMSIAFLSAQRSKDPHSQSGACIVNSDKRIVGIGYNGFPRNCPDQHMPWAKTGESILHTKYPYMFPAEMNAILNKCSADVVGATMYVALFPGNECAKLIIQAGIREVVYLNNTNHETEESRCSRILFGLSGVKLTQHRPKQHKIVVDFGPNTLSENENEQVLQEQQEQHSAKPSSEEEHNIIKTLLQKEANYNIDHPSNTSMRQDYLSWDNYFLAVAFLSAQRSKDPNTQVGACIVNADRRIVGIGYNGFPRGCSDDCLPWSRKGETTLHTKYPYVCHAEMNAIMNKCTADLVGATIYVALFPCNDCAKLIIQSGIRRVVYLNDQYHDTDACRASRILFGMAGVELRQHRPHLRRIVLDLTCPSSSRMIENDIPNEYKTQK